MGIGGAYDSTASMMDDHSEQFESVKSNKPAPKKPSVFKFRNIGCINCSIAFDETGSNGTKNIIRVIPVMDATNENTIDEDRSFIKTEISNYEAFLRVFEGFLLFNNVKLADQDLWLCYNCAEIFSELSYFYDKFFRMTIEGSDVHELINFGGESAEELEEVIKKPKGRPKRKKPKYKEEESEEEAPLPEVTERSRRGRKRKHKKVVDPDFLYDNINSPSLPDDHHFEEKHEDENFEPPHSENNEEPMDPIDIKAMVKVEVESAPEDNNEMESEPEIPDGEDEYEPDAAELSAESNFSDDSDYWDQIKPDRRRECVLNIS